MDDILTQRIESFRNMITQVEGIIFSEFNAIGEPVFCSAENQSDVFLLLSSDKLTSVEQMQSPGLAETYYTPELGANKAYPLVTTNSLGMMWISETLIADGHALSVHLMGPVFPDDYSLLNIGHRMDVLNIPVSEKKLVFKLVDSIPVIPLEKIFDYGKMLHYALYGEAITESDFTYSNAEIPSRGNDDQASARIAPNQTAMLTEQLLDAVSSGNLYYKKIMNDLSVLNSNGSIPGISGLRAAKDALIMLTGFCAQASIRGNLPASVSYALRDTYVQAIEDCRDSVLLSHISKTMIDDYVTRVHKIKMIGSASPQIQDICEQISMDPGGDHSISSAAASLGYSDYYFSKKFKSETGKSFCDYITEQRIKKSQVLLKNSRMSMQDIAEELGFSSQNYFARKFKEITGMSPSEYRSM